MNTCHVIKADKKEIQEGSVFSFIGGHPIIPKYIKIPVCELCGYEQTFYFQISFPESHNWFNKTMSIFACTSCANEDYLIPEMINQPLYNVVIPEGFMKHYQKNFSIMTFNTSDIVMRLDYQPKLVYKRIELIHVDDKDIVEHKIGGNPNWLLEDESPESYNKSNPMFFIMQLLEDYKFEKLDSAPPQVKLGLSGEMKPSKHNYYELFIANNIYFFGTLKDEPEVYIITQI